MTHLIGTLINDINKIFTGLSTHLQLFPVSTIFLIVVFFSFLVNLLKRILLWLEKKQVKPHESCQYLVLGSKGQDCDLPSRRKRFKKNNNSCSGCRGKTFKLTDTEAESRIASSSTWKRTILVLASYSNASLPYISFIYTLVVTILEDSK